MTDAAIRLRPYQEEGARLIREAYAQRKRAPLYVLPTGGGKTVLFAHVAHAAASKNNRVLILSHRIELVDQISGALAAADTAHGFIAAGYSSAPEQCMIASVSTLLRRLERVSEPQLIIVDEAHHARSETWEHILTRWPRAKLLGVTATPVRTSGEGLGKIFDHLIIGPSVAELTATGYLAPARVFAPPTVDTSGLHTRAGDFVANESEALLDKPAITGSAVKHYERLAMGLPALAFCVSVKHAQNVAEEFRANGHSAMSLDGKTARDVRRGVVADFRRGAIKILASCDLFSEGFDVPGVHVGIMLRPTQSLGLYSQQVGRILRPAEGKTHALILDHCGNTQRFGLPNEPRIWSLEGEDRKRKKPSTAIRICPSCFCALPPRMLRCDQCGHAFEAAPRTVPEREGELTEITADDLERRRARREQGRAQTLEQLLEIERQRGYKPGWARHIFAARGGHRAQRQGNGA